MRAYILLTLTMFFWGANAIAGKLAIGHISPMLLTTVRWGMALAILLCFTIPQVRRDREGIRKHWLMLTLLGAAGFAVFNVALYSALEFTSAINVVIEQAGMPMVIFLANFLLFRIRVTGAQILGFVLTAAGVAAAASSGSLERLMALELNKGDAIMLFGVLLYGGYTVALRFKPEMHWQSLMTVMVLAAFVTSLPFTFWEISRGAVIWPDARGWMVAAYTAIFPSLVSQVYFMRGTELIGSNRAGLFINLVPIFGTMMSVVILGEILHLYHVVALTLVMGGIALAERRRPAELPSSP